MAKSLDWYKGKMDEMIEDDNERNELFFAIDDMFHGEIELPDVLKEFDDIRLNKDSTPHDALYNGTTFLANSKVRFDITPLGSNPMELLRANRMEEALSWHWSKANMRGMSRKIFDIAHSALRYDLCVTRVDDLLHWLPKDESQWSKANRRAMRAGRFLITVRPPHAMHFQTSPLGGTSCILFAQVLPLSEVIDYYEGLAGTNDEGQKILSVLDRIKEKVEGETEKYNFMLYDYTDDDRRIVCGNLTDSTVKTISNEQKGDEFTLIDAENKLPFINYTVRGGASEAEPDVSYRFHPMLASAHWHGLWADSVLAKSLAFSDIIRRLRETREVYTGIGTDQVPPDSGTGEAKALPPNVDIKRLPPTQIDPQAWQVIMDYQAALNKTTGTSILGNLNDIAASTPFSSINAQIQLAEGNMNPQRNIIQDTIADIAYLFCEWTKYTKKPLQAWRGESKKIGNRMMPMGQEIQISDADYDLARLFIKCTITPETPTDQTQRINNARFMVEMGMPKRDALESLGVPHPESALDENLKEKMKEGAVQAEISRMVQEAQAQIQMMVQQAQVQMQQQAQAAQQPQQTPFDGAQGQGFNPATGGQPPIQAAPGMGREQMNGMTAGGEDLA